MDGVSAEIEGLRGPVVEQGDDSDLPSIDDGELYSADRSGCTEKGKAISIRGDKEYPATAGKRDASE